MKAVIIMRSKWHPAAEWNKWRTLFVSKRFLSLPTFDSSALWLPLDSIQSSAGNLFLFLDGYNSNSINSGGKCLLTCPEMTIYSSVHLIYMNIVQFGTTIILLICYNFNFSQVSSSLKTWWTGRSTNTTCSQSLRTSAVGHLNWTSGTFDNSQDWTKGVKSSSLMGSILHVLQVI